ncbi:MAG: outer membrane beta-barrel protein, partial [Sulfurimonas sp.]
MKKLLLSTALCASMMFAANSDYKYEITPMIAGTYAEGNLSLDQNYANAGLSFGINLDDSMFDQIELGFLRTIEDVDYENSTKDTGITRFFANLIKEYELTSSTSLYALAGAGIELFDNQDFQNENGLFGNYGFGVKYQITDDIALKADLRHLIEIDNGDNNLIYTVGLAIPFGKKAAPSPKTETKEVTPVKTETKPMEKDS